MVVFSAQLTAANFVFEFELSSVDTRGNCAGDDLSIGCETYLSTFCLRLQSETDGCSLGSSGRYGPGGGLPITRRISSTSPWPVSLICMLNTFHFIVLDRGSKAQYPSTESRMWF